MNSYSDNGVRVHKLKLMYASEYTVFAILTLKISESVAVKHDELY
jgi:hypothetical protein